MHAPQPALIAYRDPSVHARRRRPWNRAFNTTSLKEFQPIIVNRARQLVDILRARRGQVVDIAEWISFFTCVHRPRSRRTTDTLRIYRYDFMGDMA